MAELEPTGRTGSGYSVATPAWLILPPTPELPRPTRSDLVKLNDTSVFFAQFGTGPPIMLLHGGLANSNYWGHQITHLAQGFSVIAMDTRGHGRSPLTSPSLVGRNFQLWRYPTGRSLPPCGRTMRARWA